MRQQQSPLKGGQCTTQKYMKPLLERIARGEIDPPEIVSHRATLEQAPATYGLFEREKDECTKVVMKP